MLLLRRAVARVRSLRRAAPAARIAAGALTATTLLCLWGSSSRRQRQPLLLQCDDGVPRGGLSDAFKAELQKHLDGGSIDYDSNELAQHGKPYNSYHNISRRPDVVVYPTSTAEVSSVVKLCAAHKVPIIPYGGGTSLEGQLLATHGGISMDFTRMNSVLQLNEKDLDITVQAGLGYVELNQELRPLGLWFPLDPGPGATVGGMCATRCSGSTAVRYGSMRDNVLNVTAVLADGTVIKTGSRARKSSAGYDLTRLLIGSEGTLGIITEVTLKLHGIPKHSCAMRITFPSIRAAAQCASDTLNCGCQIGRCELLDAEMVSAVAALNPDLEPRWREAVTLLYEVTGLSEQAVREQLAAIEAVARSSGAEQVYVATGEEESAQMWALRKGCLWSTMAMYPDREPMITDVCVPLSQLPELIEETKAELDRSPLPCPIVAHAGDGNFHVFIMFRADVQEEVLEARRLAEDMARRAIRRGGTCTGEHGVGVGKMGLLREEVGEATVGAMRKIKHSLDPDNIMNPHKVFDFHPPPELSHGKRDVKFCN